MNFEISNGMRYFFKKVIMLQIIAVFFATGSAFADADLSWQHVSLTFQNAQKKLQGLRISDKKYGSFDIPLRTRSQPPAVIFNISSYKDIILRVQDSVQVIRKKDHFVVELDLPQGNYRATLIYQTRKWGGKKFPFESSIFSLYPNHHLIRGSGKAIEIAPIQNFKYQFLSVPRQSIRSLTPDEITL